MPRHSASPQRRSLRERLTLLIAVIVLPTVGLVSFLIVQSYRNQRAAVATELRNTARAVASIVDGEVSRSLTLLGTLSATRALNELDFKALDATSRRALARDKHWFVLTDSTGQQLVNTLVPAETPLPKVDIAALLKNGLQLDGTFVSDLTVGPVANQLVIFVGRAFKHPSGRRFGLALVMPPQVLGDALDVERFAPNGVLSVLDRDGRIIVRSRSPEKFVGQFATPDIVKVTRENAEGVGESVTLENIPVLTAYARARCGWSVAIGVPKSQVYAPARRLLILALTASALVALLAIAIAFWIRGAVVRSVDALTQDAEAMARGQMPEARESDLAETDFIGRVMRRMTQSLALELEAKSLAEAELRKARDRLGEYAQELERKVEERTSALREAMIQMEEFSYTVSHDLRSPLRAIGGYSTVLLEDYGTTLDAHARDYLQRIQRATHRMDQLTTDVLKYSRIARAELRREPVDLERLTRNVIEHYRELQADAANVKIIPPLHRVLAHETSLTQCVANLLTNAAKFVRAGERPDITIRSELRGENVRLWVEDRGLGIDQSQQDRLFQMFERAPNSRGYEGTGVGLAIVRKAMEKMGGSCGVVSDGVTGSQFWIELRAA